MKTLDELVKEARTNLGIVSAQIPTVDLLVASFRLVDNLSEETVLRRLLAVCIDERKAIISSNLFFMVFREGGNAPKFKHDTRESAELEAARIARESGNDTYVLAVVAKHEGRAAPTNEEVRKHAEAFPCELNINGQKWGLWRVVPEAGLPRLVAATPGYNDSPIFSDGITCIRPPIGKWEPVTKSGDSIDDCPF